jgi:CHAD domain-containing protein
MRKRFSEPLQLADQVREIAGSALTAALKAAAEPGKTPVERVHQARRNIKKLRALLHLVRPGFADYALENAAARDAAKGISPLRDADVLKDTLADLLDTVDLPGDDVTPLRASLDARTPDPAAHDRVLAEFAHAALPILDRVHGWRLDEQPDLLREGAADTYRRARRAMRKAERLGGPDRFHEWRKQVKHQFYQLALISAVTRSDPLRREQLKRLATMLGKHHDRTVFRDFLVTHPDRKRFAALADAAAEEQEQLERKALKLGKGLFRRSARKWAGTLAEGRAPPDADAHEA